MRAIIVGGGNVGFYLAQTLCEHGYSVTIIEKDKERSIYCANNLKAEIVCGDGTSVEVLRSCGSQKADALIAVTGKDEKNLVCCRIAKKLFGTGKIIAKVNDPRNESTLKALGVDIVISATNNIIHLLEHEVDLSPIKKLIDLGENDAALMEITLPENTPMEGKTIQDISLPQDCNIACINRDGRTIIPRGKTMLIGGDVLMIVTLASEEKALRKALKIKDK